MSTVRRNDNKAYREASGRCAYCIHTSPSRESQSFIQVASSLRYGYSTLVVEVSDDDDEQEEGVDNDGGRLHYDDAS